MSPQVKLIKQTMQKKKGPGEMGIWLKLVCLFICLASWLVLCLFVVDKTNMSLVQKSVPWKSERTPGQGLGSTIFLILTQCGDCVFSPLNGVRPHNHTQLASVRETGTQEMEEKRERRHCSKENRVTTPNHQIPRREMEKGFAGWA